MTHAELTTKSAAVIDAFAKLHNEYLAENDLPSAGRVNDAIQNMDVVTAAKLYDILKAA